MTEKQLTTQSILDEILSLGKEYLEKGQDIVEHKLNIPEQGEQRDAMLSGLKKGAFSSAVLLGLIGTKGGRKLTGVALKIGGVAALGTAAYKGYRHWLDQKQDNSSQPVGVHELREDAAYERAKLLISAMVAAANADGNIDNEEQQKLKHEILHMHLPKHLADDLQAIIDSPSDVQSLAAKVGDIEIASEVYLASRLFIGEHSSVTERMYLEQLVAEMGLNSSLIKSLETQLA